MRQQIGTGEFYHIYNRGVDKRTVFEDKYDTARFLQSMREFNVLEPIGSIYELQFGTPSPKSSSKDGLVNVLAYCLNPNHFHFILEQLVEGGVSKFMQKLGGGYTNYFNEKHKRSGALFQGKYKYSHIKTDERLIYLSAYVNLNHKVHKLGSWSPKSSMGQYLGEVPEEWEYKVENKGMILSHFADPEEYEEYASSIIDEVIKNREELEKDILE